MAKKKSVKHLSRRESQIMDIVYRLGEATVHQVLAEMHDAPSYSAARAELGILEKKGLLKHKWDGPRFVYMPKTSLEAARKTALWHVIDTYFGGSSAEAAKTLAAMA